MQVGPIVPAHVPPAQLKVVAIGLQLAVKVELLPKVIADGEAVSVHTGEPADVGHACHLPLRLATSHAASIAATPLDVNPGFPQRLLPPGRRVLGAAGSGPVNCWQHARKFCRFGTPLNEGIAPANRLPPARKNVNEFIPLRVGSDPVNLLPKTSIANNAGRPEIVGKGPARLLESSVIVRTLACNVSHVMPNHVHSVPTAPFQFVLLTQEAPLVELYISISAALWEAGMTACAADAQPKAQSIRIGWSNFLMAAK